MPNTPSSEEIKRAATALFEERVGAVTAVADATRERIAKQAEAAQAERREAAAWADAVRRGWTESELKGMGLVAPGRKSPGRPRSAAAAASRVESDAAKKRREDAEDTAVALRYEADSHAAIEEQV
jgi:hypothetical protein